MQADRQLSEPWTGRTIFSLLRQPLPDGWEWQQGRATRKQKTTRPPTVWPEFWKMLSSKQKEQAAREWVLEKPRLEAAQAARGFTHVPEDDNEYLGIINAARARLARGEPPAMLCIPYVCYSAGGDPCRDAPGVQCKKAGGDPCSGARGVQRLSDIRPHQDRTAPKGYASLDQMAMVHLPIAIDKAMKIPEAKKAVDAEWEAHARKGTWNAKRVRPRAEVIAEAFAKKVSVHWKADGPLPPQAR